MENGASTRKYPGFCYWNTNKYRSNYPPEHWNLCRLFMEIHKTKYPEARLAQLTEAFYNMGVHGRCSDPKTDRMVATLSAPVLDLFLHFYPGAISHPFRQNSVEDAIDSGQEIKPGSEAKSIEPSTTEDSSRLRERVSPTEEKQESSSQSSSSLENRQCSLEGNLGSSGSRPHSSEVETHTPVGEQHSTEEEQKIHAQKRVLTEPKEGSDKNKVSDDQNSGVSESKRRRLTPTNDKPSNSKVGASSDDHYKLNKLTDRNSLQRLLRGFVVIRDVSKDSTLNRDVAVVEDSFNRSKFGPCTWHISKISKSKDIKRIRLQLGDEVLVEAEGQNKEFVQLKIAKAFIARVASFSPVIKATYTYYNSGNCRELPNESPKGPCKHYLNHYSCDRLKGLIDGFAQKKEFLEMIVLHHPESPDDFHMQDIIQFIEKERADKLRYRLANFSYKGTTHSAICVSYIHDGVELLEWLQKHEDQRYCVIFDKANETEFWRYARQKGADETLGNGKEERKDSRKPNKNSTNRNTGSLSDRSRSSTKHPSLDIKSGPRDSPRDKVSNKSGSSQSQSSSKHGSQIKNSTSKDVQRVQADRSAGNNRHADHSVARISAVEPPLSKQPPVPAPASISSGRNVQHVQADRSAGNNRHADHSVARISAVEPPLSKQPPVPAPASISSGRKEKNEELQWVGKEHLSALAKSIYLVKFVKEDSTTESDPFNLLKSTCSLAFNVDFRYAMKCEEHSTHLVKTKSKRWHMTVVMMYDQGNILVGEAMSSDCAEARLAAAQDAVSTIQTYCRVIEPNFNYFAEGGVPRFISLKKPIKTSTYEIMIMNTIKNPLNQQVVNLMLEMFVKDSTVEDLFFLASDYTSEERELVRKTAEQFKLGWRLFGQRSRASTAGDMVSTQHVCVFRPKTAEELVQQLIVCGGSTEKYSIVTRNNTTTLQVDISPAAAETPAPSELREICDHERLPGGCFNSKCSLAHLNILDSVVNQFFGVR